MGMVGGATRYSSKCTRTHQIFNTKRPHCHHRKLAGKPNTTIIMRMSSAASSFINGRRKLLDS